MPSRDTMETSMGLTAFAVLSNILAFVVRIMHAVHAAACWFEKPADHTWQKPSGDDRRSPCPMLNALANHGYLPRDGKNISLVRLVTALEEAINLSPDATLFAGIIALRTSTTGNRWTFNLDDLADHGVLEHDGSLSRHDASAPPPLNNWEFAPEVWAGVLRHFADSKTISVETAARARSARVAEAREMDPAFSMSAADERASVLETCLYLRVFGEGTAGEAITEWVRVLFEQERLPYNEGFTRPTRVVTISDLLALAEKVNAVTGSKTD